MKKLQVLLFILCIISLTNCKKKVLDENPDFEGVWESESVGDVCSKHTVIIDKDNKGSYRYWSAGADEDDDEGTVRIKDDCLKIGTFKKFKINEMPTSSNGTINECSSCFCGDHRYTDYMVLDHIKYYKFVSWDQVW
ncbi:MAG: hypothetical protein ACJA0Q_001432 [Saprospiraceae bacterium]|jgi:hypothetical protein